MRRPLIFSIVAIPMVSYAQNWELFPVGMKLHYKVAPQTHIRISADTSRVVGNREVYYLGSNALKPCLPWEVITDPYWNFVDSLVRDGSTYVKHYHDPDLNINDSAVFDFGVALGESFRVRFPWSWPEDYDSIIFTLDSAYTEILFGSPDSIKRFTLQAWKQGPVSGRVNDYPLLLSRSHGLVAGPMLFTGGKWIGFRGTYKHEYVELAGFQADSTAPGYQFPEFDDIFGYKPEWIYKWRREVSDYTQSTYTYWRDSIMSVTRYSDSVMITVRRESATGTSTLNITYTKAEIAGALEANHHYFSKTGIEGAFQQVSPQGMLSLVEDGYWISDCQLAVAADVCNRYDHGEMIGFAGHYKCHWGGYEELRIIGFKSDSLQWGSHGPLGLNEVAWSDVSISPNPCTDRIQVSARMPRYATYTIQDVTGHVVQTGDFNDGDIPIHFTQPGIFFILIDSFVGKFIKL